MDAEESGGWKHDLYTGPKVKELSTSKFKNMELSTSSIVTISNIPWQVDSDDLDVSLSSIILEGVTAPVDICWNYRNCSLLSSFLPNRRSCSIVRVVPRELPSFTSPNDRQHETLPPNMMESNSTDNG